MSKKALTGDKEVKEKEANNMRNDDISKADSITFRLPRWEDLPEIGLYLDQVLELIESWLGKDRLLTKTMINNYVKQKHIPAPVNKRYDKTAVASLIAIALLKQVFTIDEISRLIALALEKESQSEAFDRFCEMTESAVANLGKGNPADPKERGIMWNVTNAFASQLYVRNHLPKRD